MSKATSATCQSGPRILCTWHLPISLKPIDLRIERDTHGYDRPVLEGGEYEAVLMRTAPGLIKEEKLPLPAEEDRQFFISVILPQARKQIAEHYVHRSDLGEWCDLMRQHQKKRPVGGK